MPLWKLRRLDDAFYTLSAGVVTTVASHLDLKAEFSSTDKNRRTSPLLKKRDHALVLSVVYTY